jgi:hypothetical protein
MNDDLKRLELVIESFLRSESASALRRIRDDMLYRDAGHETFKEYCRTLLPPMDDEILDGLLVMLS